MIDRAPPKSVDVAVVGAGPAGSATALRLARQGCTVALIERSGFEAPRVGESFAPAVQPLLCELDAWTAFLALSPLPSYGTRGLWGDATPQTHSHLVTPWGCGWHVDRCAFDRMLAERAAVAGAAVLLKTTCIRCEQAPGGWTLDLIEGGHRAAEAWPLRARVVIDATGRAARLARWFGAWRFVFDHLVALATPFCGVDTACEGYVMVETTADGWWYTAPMPAGRMMAMLMTDGDLCGRADLASPPVWHARLRAAAATHRRLSVASALPGPRVLSALSQRLGRRERHRAWLAVGDAALAVDPVSGSGVVRALRTARAAAETALLLLDDPVAGAVEAYEADRDGECTVYLEERALYYGIEQRWRTSAFWQRRIRAEWTTSAGRPR